MTAIIALVTCSASALCSAENQIPHAAAEDYAWVILEKGPPQWIDITPCYNHNQNQQFANYQSCVFSAREAADNRQSRVWGLDAKVVREKDTLYIDVPNRQLPLVFKDDMGVPDAEYETSYMLSRFDEPRQLLYLTHSLYESNSTVIVDLNSGFWQELWGEGLVMSPDRHYLAGFESDIEANDRVVIWKKSTDGFDQGYYKSIHDNYEQYDDQQALKERYKKFYQADEAYEVYNARKITWLDNTQFNADHFYTVNDEDTAAFRLRYNFVLEQDTDQWRMFVRTASTN